MMRARFSMVASLVLAISACSDDEKAKTEPHDAGSGGPMSDGDAQVDYMGPTRGGQIPVGAELEAGPGDDGPFVVSDDCCQRTLSIPELGGETSVRVRGNLPPLDGEGIEAQLAAGAFRVEACMPVSVAVQYRFEVELEDDGGTATSHRTDPTQPTLEDENGDAWNLSVIASCEADGGT
jgi:hypothetical protein